VDKQANSIAPVVVASKSSASALLNGQSTVDKAAQLVAEEDPPPVVRLRQKANSGQLKPKSTIKPAMQLRDEDQLNGVSESNGHAPLSNGTSSSNGNVVEAPEDGLINGSLAVGGGNSQIGSTSSAAALLHRTMEALYEASPDMEDNTEEIRKLDSQLDHLNEYMDRVEERLKAHNEKLMETLKQQKEEREKRRRSFHERLEASRQEDDDFQRQLNQMLTKVDISRNRQSMCELPSNNGTTEHAVDEVKQQE